MMYGVILMGGKSSRIGQDKAYIEWGEKPMYLLAHQKLSKFCGEVFLSINKRQSANQHHNLLTIIDQYEGEGPITGMISAFRKIRQPIIFIGCDMPYVSTEDIQILIDHFSLYQRTSMFYNVAGICYEPLLSIWNTEMLTHLDDYYTNGGRSINHFLKQLDIEHILPPDPQRLKSINHKADLP